MKLHISTGNSKLGKIPNISLPPIITCPDFIPCYYECYCNKNFFYLKKAKEKWNENYELLQCNPYEFFSQLQSFLQTKKPKYFRFHTGGDCPDQNYVDNIILIAEICKNTKFLIFTKRYSFNFYDGQVPNFKVKYSAWGRMVPYKKPVAWLYDGKGEMPKGFKCTGKCDKCYWCWENNEDVVLFKH